MPAVETLEKWTSTGDLFTMDFRDEEAVRLRGETLSSPTWSATPSGLTITPVAISGGQVQARISGGAAGGVYVVKCVVSTSGSNTLCGIGVLRVPL